MRVLLVCTANRCRSPISAALLAQRLSARSGVEVDSAGLLPGGGHVPPQGLAHMRRFGLDLSGHVSRQVEPSDLERADLILTMTRRHSREILARDSESWRICYPLKDFVRRAELARQSAGELSFPALLDAVGEGRTPDSVMGSSRNDDVRDPMGKSSSVWADVVSELAAQVLQLTTVLAPPALPHGAPGTTRRARRQR